MSQTKTAPSSPAPRPTSRLAWFAAAVVAMLAMTEGKASAQARVPGGSRYYPLDQTIRPGVAGEWMTTIRGEPSTYFQPVRVELPVEAKVTFFGLPNDPAIPQPAPARAAILVGPVYRLRISNMPDYPGAELFPTVELLDRLHPPPGKAINFPIPVSFTVRELEFAMEGRLVTKVVYLEQPNRADPVLSQDPDRTRTIEPQENAIAVADQLGRPMAIVRLGGRLPDPLRREPEFFGTGAPLMLPPQTVTPRNETAP